MNVEMMKKAEDMAEAYLKASNKARDAALSLMTEREREVFLMYVGAYHLMIDERFYNEVKDAMCESLLEEVGRC